MTYLILIFPRIARCRRHVPLEDIRRHHRRTATITPLNQFSSQNHCTIQKNMLLSRRGQAEQATLYILYALRLPIEQDYQVNYI